MLVTGLSSSIFGRQRQFLQAQSAGGEPVRLRGEYDPDLCSTFLSIAAPHDQQRRSCPPSGTRLRRGAARRGTFYLVVAAITLNGFVTFDLLPWSSSFKTVGLYLCRRLPSVPR